MAAFWVNYFCTFSPFSPCWMSYVGVVSGIAMPAVVCVDLDTYSLRGSFYLSLFTATYHCLHCTVLFELAIVVRLRAFRLY